MFTAMPQRVPPFDSAFVDMHNRAALKVLVKAAPDDCHIVAFTDGTGAAYAMKLLHKRNFKLRCISLELDLSSLCFTGRIAYQFTRGQYVHTPLSRYFCRGDNMLHELAQCQGNVIDMFCLGPEFHALLKKRERGKSLVFVEE